MPRNKIENLDIIKDKLITIKISNEDEKKLKLIENTLNFKRTDVFRFGLDTLLKVYEKSLKTNLKD